MATWLVTGGAGFIGSHIVDELLEKKEKVIVLDNLSASGNTANLTHALGRIRFVKGDIRDRDLLKRTLRNVNFVSHQAAIRSVARSVDDPFFTNDVNITGTLSLLWECRRAGVKRVAYASSSSTYGDSLLTPQRESQTPAPISPYAVSKLAAEHYCRVFSKTFGLETVALRYFNVFGPRQDPNSKYSAVIPLFMQSARDGKPFLIDGDGRQSRDFTYVKNIAEANWLAARAPKAAGENFNIAGGENRSVLEVARCIAKLADRPFRAKHRPSRKGDVRKTCADPAKARRLLGWTPSVSFINGLSLTWNAFGETFGPETVKIALTGVGGLLGPDVWARLETDHEVWASGRKRPLCVSPERWRALDITRDKETYSVITRLNPDLVIHMAAMTNPDDCENALEEAFRVNALGTRNIAIACQRFDTMLMHLSTNYVFGAGQPPEGGYREFDVPDPVNTYGRSKQWAEDFIRSLLNKFFIVRTAGLFGAGRPCFATEIMEACRQGRSIQAAPWTGSYTYTVDLAEAMARLVESNLYGIYHVVNEGAGSRDEFIRQVSRNLPPSRGFKIVEAKDLKRPAQRPGQSTLNTIHWRLSGFEPLRPWKEALNDFVGKN